MPTQFSFIKNIPLSEPPYTQAAVVIPIAAIPAAIGALENRARYAVWGPGVELNGVQIIRRLQLSLLIPFQGMDNIYRLLDNALNGTIYTEDTPGIVLPAIPTIPRDTFEADFIRDELARITAAIEAMGETSTDLTTIISDLEAIMVLLG